MRLVSIGSFNIAIIHIVKTNYQLAQNYDKTDKTVKFSITRD